tara:strand:- start:404 stop:766 length:363 start_codon:yes stop_codon:yes gene_type:complete
MLTVFKEIFIWWNRQTLGTRIYTFLKGKFVGKDEFGNKYYENKNKNKRWVIYQGEIDASKISNEWYSWIHFIKNKIELNQNLKKYSWQKPHLSNKTGTSKSYHPNKKNNEIKKKYSTWKG